MNELSCGHRESPNYPGECIFHCQPTITKPDVLAALAHCADENQRSIAAQESKLSAICQTDRVQWLSVKSFPPPDRHLVLLHGPMGKWGIGFFDKGIQMEGYNVADWKAAYWTTLPNGPNKMLGNFIDSPEVVFSEAMRDIEP